MSREIASNINWQLLNAREMYINMSPFTHVHKWNINESNKDDYEIAENTCEIIKQAMRNDGGLWWCNKKVGNTPRSENRRRLEGGRWLKGSGGDRGQRNKSSQIDCGKIADNSQMYLSPSSFATHIVLMRQQFCILLDDIV